MKKEMCAGYVFGHDYRRFKSELSEISSESLMLGDFVAFLADRLSASEQMRLLETYFSAFSSFMAFRQGKDILIADIDSLIIEDYELFLKARGLSMNTISFYMRILRAIYNRAVNIGVVHQRYPFKSVYTGIARTEKRALPLCMLRKIKNLDLSMSPKLSYARDIFMFSFYTRGMSFVDMAYLRKVDLSNGVLSYRRRKTGRLMAIKWESCMQEIVDRYDNVDSEYMLPIITCSKDSIRRQYRNALFNVNRLLKKVACLADIHITLTTYVARHTWATAARYCKIPLPIISESLGHESEKTTYIYLASIDAVEIDNANRAVLNLL